MTTRNSQNRTKPTNVSVDAHLAAIESDDQRNDCLALIRLMTRITGEEPKMWGPTIVGFGSYHYPYESGREGDACHYVRRLSEVDAKVLEQLVSGSVEEVRRRYG